MGMPSYTTPTAVAAAPTYAAAPQPVYTSAAPTYAAPAPTYAAAPAFTPSYTMAAPQAQLLAADLNHDGVIQSNEVFAAAPAFQSGTYMQQAAVVPQQQPYAFTQQPTFVAAPQPQLFAADLNHDGLIQSNELFTSTPVMQVSQPMTTVLPTAGSMVAYPPAATNTTNHPTNHPAVDPAKGKVDPAKGKVDPAKGKASLKKKVPAKAKKCGCC